MKKINTLVKILFTICFLCLSQILISQENNSKNVSKNPKGNSKEGQLNTNDNIHKSRVSGTENHNSSTNLQKQVDTKGKSFQLDENDYYQGRKEEFLSQITLKELPLDFPKYEKWMGVKSYNQIIDEYYRKHLDILKPIVKNKLTQY